MFYFLIVKKGEISYIIQSKTDSYSSIRKHIWICCKIIIKTAVKSFKSNNTDMFGLDFKLFLLNGRKYNIQSDQLCAISQERAAL